MLAFMLGGITGLINASYSVTWWFTTRLSFPAISI